MASKKDGMEVGGAHRPAHLSFTPSRWVIPVLGDALALSVRDRSFDAVVCFEVIKQLPDVAGRGRRDAQGTETPGALDLRASEPRIVVDSPWKTLSWVAGGWRLASTDGEGHCNGGPGTDTFLYREPVLDGVTGGDGDAVYDCSPLLLLRLFQHTPICSVGVCPGPPSPRVCASFSASSPPKRPALIAFGVQDLVFNMFIVPNAVPWDLNGTNRWGALWVEFGELVRKGRPFVLMIVVGVILTAPRVPTVSGVRSWLRGRSWVLLTLIGMAMIPTSLLGAVKAGGGSNSFSFMTYFLSVAGTTVLVDAARCPNSLRSRIAKGTLIALGVGLAAHLSSNTSVFDRGWERFRQLDENPQQVAHNFLVVHPGTAYFPWNPPAHLYGGG